jgi:hypothetical protein
MARNLKYSCLMGLGTAGQLSCPGGYLPVTATAQRHKHHQAPRKNVPCSLSMFFSWSKLGQPVEQGAGSSSACQLQVGVASRPAYHPAHTQARPTMHKQTTMTVNKTVITHLCVRRVGRRPMGGPHGDWGNGQALHP